MYIPGLNIKLTAPYGLMILRVVLGLALAFHGWSKWSGGIDGVAGFFGNLGVPAPTLMAYVVSTVELVGGLFLIVGFLTQIAGILIALDMLGVIIFAYLKQGSPFVDRGSITWEKEAVFAAAALCIVLSGPGLWSVNDVVIDTRQRT